MINIVGSSRYKISRKPLKEYIKVLFQRSGIPVNATLNIVMIGKRKMTSIATEYKKEKLALPVLAFPYNESTGTNELLLGEIFICYPQAVLLAAEREKTVEETMKQLIEHGLKNILTH